VGKVFFAKVGAGVSTAKKKKIKKKKSPHAYQQRSYRACVQSGLVSTRVRMMETDLDILAPERVDDLALPLVAAIRAEIEQYIEQHPEFLHSLVPLAGDERAPDCVQKMLAAGVRAGVGPMAAVAGVVAEVVGQGLERQGYDEIIVENGGDIYLHRRSSCTVSIYAGESPLSGRVGIRLASEQMPCGVCTSSASIGHSLSLGTSDAAVVVAPSTAFADALATRLGNEVRQGKQGVQRALDIVQKVEGVTGAVVIAGEKMGVWGDVQLVQVAVETGEEQDDGKAE